MKKNLFIVVTIFCTAFLFVEEAPAQSRVCIGDTVVLVLNGYKQGSTLWLESSDLINWKTATGTSYNDSLVVTATTSLYYRARVTDGSCDKSNSDTVMITVRPALPMPIAKPASGIAPISFDANWYASTGATTYYLDVATDNAFTSFVTGYNNRKVNNKTTYGVNGILYNATYYYRVRVYDDSCGRVSGNSNTIIVTTPAYPVECTVPSTCSGNIIDTRGSKTYKTVQIGTQCWMAQNLNAGTMVQGSTHQTPGTDNQNASIEKYCYSNVAAKCDTFGGLYRWDEMMAYGLSDSIAPGPKGICPTGWHLPTDKEWTCLEKTVGTSTTTGGRLKDTTFWNAPNTGATNGSGFTALPAGYHENVNGSIFYSKGSETVWWTATESPEFLLSTAWRRYISFNSAGIARDAGAFKDTYGFSVRCVKD